MMTTEADLLERCASIGIQVTGDGRIGERDACRLLGFNKDYLRHKRDSGTGPKFFRLAAFGSSVSYRLSDLQTWIEACGADQSEFLPTERSKADQSELPGHDATRHNRRNG